MKLYLGPFVLLALSVLTKASAQPELASGLLFDYYPAVCNPAVYPWRVAR